MEEADMVRKEDVEEIHTSPTTLTPVKGLLHLDQVAKGVREAKEAMVVVNSSMVHPNSMALQQVGPMATMVVRQMAMEHMVISRLNSHGNSADNSSLGQNDVEMRPVNGNQGQAMNQGNPNAIRNECRDIDQGIDQISRNLDRLRLLQEKSLDDLSGSAGTATNRELDALSSETMTMYRNFASRIKNIKSQAESGSPTNAPQVGKTDRKLKAAINQYQTVEREFRKKLQSQMARQYRIVRPDASDAEVREAVEDTSSQQIFSQAVCVESSEAADNANPI
jgi:hypothetical protein